MASQFTNPFTNPGGFFSSQEGGFFAAPQGGRTLTGLLGDPRVNIGLAIAGGQPIGKAIMGGALQANTLQETFAKQNLKKKIADGTATKQDYIGLYPQLAAKQLFDPKVPTTKAVTLKSSGEQVLRTNTEIATNPELYSPAATGMVTKVGPDGGISMIPAALYGSQLEKDNQADNLFGATKNLANLGNRALELLDKSPIGATGGVVRGLEGIGDQVSQAAKEFGFNAKDYNNSLFKDAIENKYGTSASNNARFSGTIITLAYGLAKIEEPDNPRFSEGDIIRQIDRLGSSQSKEVFAAGIDEAITQSINRANTTYNVYKGMDMPDVGYTGLNRLDTDTVNDPLGLFPEGFPN